MGESLRGFCFICYRVNKRSQTSWSVFNVYRQSYDYAVAPLCSTYGYNDYSPPPRSHSPLMWLDPNHPVITPLPSSFDRWVTPHHMHILGSQSSPSAWPMVILSQSKALRKYSSRSVFILTALLCSTKVCDPNVLKVIPTQVSNVQCLF